MLGRFGGSATPALRIAAGGGEAGGGFLDERSQAALDAQLSSPWGMPASSFQLAFLLAAFGNLLRNSSVESWSSGVTSAPDGWTLTGAGATIARNTTNVEDRLASVDVTAALNTATDLAQSLTISGTQNTRLRGREVTFSCRVKVSTADRVFLRVDDGVLTKDSRYHVGDGNFEGLSVTLTVDAAATKIECSLEISSGASITATFDAAKLEEGGQATAYFANPIDLLLLPRYTSLTNQVSLAASSPLAYSDMTSTSLANIIVDGTQSVLLLFMGEIGFTAGTGTQNTYFGLKRGSTVIRDDFSVSIPKNVAANDHGWTLPFMHLDRKPAAGVYTYQMTWATDVDSALVTDRDLMALVFPDL
mgnify:CR=1 FL=1